MVTKATFRALITGSVSCLLFAILLGVATESLLPAELQLYLQRSSAQEGEREIAMMSLGVPVLILGLVAAIGLFMFWRWSRPLALLVTIGFVALSPLTRVFVELGWVTMFSEISTLLWGAVIALAYGSPIRAEFDRRDQAA